VSHQQTGIRQKTETLSAGISDYSGFALNGNRCPLYSGSVVASQIPNSVARFLPS
jgi:hypothetical protein